jgi:hypothetical protein
VHNNTTVRGSSYRRVLCAAATRVVGRRLRASGRGKAKGWSLPAKTPALYPSFREELRLFYSGIGPVQSEGCVA